MNSIDCAGVIKELVMMGNDDAVLVVTANKGYRKVTGRKHPHSWSVADPAETVNWLLRY